MAYDPLDIDEKIDYAAKKFQSVGEALVSSIFGNLTIFVDETLPKLDKFIAAQLGKVDAVVDTQLKKVKALKINVSN
jgi:flagellar biosynthesis/type III secretory pathway protein FliH